MTKEAAEFYEKTQKESQRRFLAKHIFARVNEARDSIPSAGRRWPFELLQNALDFGPRTGRSLVMVSLSSQREKVVFEHDGIPFSAHDLDALLSGGSNKDFESEETTGRFGTGFLVTHVLAERARLRGLLNAPNGYEQFNLFLDRGGDVEAILGNMKASITAIHDAIPVQDSDLHQIPSARFEYHIDDENPLTLGIDSLRSALPYLFATRQILGRVELQNGKESSEIWQPGEVRTYLFDDSHVEGRSLQIQHACQGLTEFRTFRFKAKEDSSASALVLVERITEGWKVVPPEEDDPIIYREYPLRGSGFLPTNFVLDGKFDPNEDRSGLLMNEKSKELIREAFNAAVMAVKFAFAKKWEDAHLLAKVCMPSGSFDTGDPEEKKWWAEQLESFAQRVAELPIVAGTAQMLPAISQNGGTADFIIPSLFSDSSLEETNVERMWPLVERVTNLLPPRKELVSIWTEIAQGWHSLDVPVNRISVKVLAEWAGKNADTLDGLQVDGDATQWLSSFVDIVGECWRNRSGVDLTVLGGLLPDQNRRLRSPSDLTRDDGISEVLKDICADMGLDVREHLIHGDLQKASSDGNLPNLKYALEKAVPNVTTEEDVFRKAIEHLRTRLPEGRRCDNIPIGVQHGSVRLLHYIWATKGEDGISLVQQISPITNANIIERWSRTRKMMAPVSHWHESARPFAEAYPPNRVLHEMYTGCTSGDIPNCVVALINWGIAIADPITTYVPSELTRQRLAELSTEDTKDVTVPNNNEEFSQIALLQPEVLNRCRDGIEEARALLGLILRYIAPHDSGWRREQIVKGRRSGQDIEIAVKGALWLADLKIRAWVPVSGEDGKPVPMPAKVETLHDLLAPGWLEGNNDAIELLSNEFGFDQLELRLLGIETDSNKRGQLRDGLASLVEVGGSNPAFYSSLSTLAGLAGSDLGVYSSLTDLAKLAKCGKVDLAELVEKQQRQSRDVDRFRRLGMGVQEAIKLALEHHKLSLELVDRGFDYKVTGQTDDVLGDASAKFGIGPYLLEVKATTTGHARMTPLQAKTASKEARRYVLCVVDLRSMKNGQLPDTWSASIVESLTKIVPDIGTRIRGTYSLVETARNSEIAVRNEAALRYQVPSAVWETGITIDEWVSTIKANNASQVATP